MASGRGAQQSPQSPATLVGILLLATAATLHVAAELLIPITFAILLNVLLSPTVRTLQRHGVPAGISAAALVATLLGIVVMLITFLAEPAEQWLEDAPRSIRELQSQSFSAKKRLADIQQLADEVDELTSTDLPGSVQSVVVQGPDLLESLLGGLPSVIAFAAIVVFLTFFLLASGDTLLRRMTRWGRTWTERRRIVCIAHQIQSDLSRYLALVTAINLTLGTVVAVAMHLLNVPNPLLWGAMVTLFNFAPYVGALASSIVLTVVGFTEFDSAAKALAVPGIFVCLTILEGQLITPAVVGKQKTLSPLFVFLSVIFWGWLWGVAGALMAVPLVTSLKVIADHVPSLRPVGEFVRGDGGGRAPR